jgi:plastocyanin
MVRSRGWMAWVCAGALVTAACGDDDGAENPGGTGGTGGTGGAGAGGGGAGGSGGASGGAAGSGGTTATSLCSCTEASAQDLTAQAQATVSFACCDYSPGCIKVKVGTQVTWSGAFDEHPMSPFATLGTLPNPIPTTSTGASVSVTFTAAGAYGFVCTAHGAELAVGGGMCGAVFVVP